MTTTRLVRARPWPGARWIAAGAALALVAAAAGWLVAHRIAAHPAPVRPLTSDRVLRAGPARLRVSVPWTPAKRPPAVPGLADAPAWTPYAGITTTVSVALLPAQDASLLPGALAQGKLPKPETAKLGGVQAHAYRGLRSGDSVLDVYVVPTTRGVLTLACAAAAQTPEAPAWCLNGLEQITVDGARPLRPAADTAYRLGAPVLLRTLDGARVRNRRALRAAHLYVGQARAARGLAATYQAAARAVAPLAPASGAAAAVPGALRTAAAAYGGLARAAVRRDKRAWSRSRAAVRRAEVTVARRVSAAR
jgi:hypothetical protein